MFDLTMTTKNRFQDDLVETVNLRIAEETPLYGSYDCKPALVYTDKNVTDQETDDLPYGITNAASRHGITIRTQARDNELMQRERLASSLSTVKETRTQIIAWFLDQQRSTETLNGLLRHLEMDEYTGKFQVEVSLNGDEVCTVIVDADDEDMAEDMVKEAMEVDEITISFSCSGDGIKVEGYMNDATDYDTTEILRELYYSVTEYTG